jgi:hypothetical protein
MKRTANVSERLQGVSIGADCVKVGVLLEDEPGRSNSMQSLVSPQSFPHLWKKLWKSDPYHSGVSIQGLIHADSAGAKPRGAVQMAFLGGRMTPACGKSGFDARRKPAEGAFPLNK